jgi:hypothetical protein
VVPPEQAEVMHRALLSRGVTTALVMYRGEQHGFRSAAAIRSALEGELYFYGKASRAGAGGTWAVEGSMGGLNLGRPCAAPGRCSPAHTIDCTRHPGAGVPLDLPR